MTDRTPDSDARLSTDVGIHEAGPRIGSVPGQAAEVDISGYPGDGTGWGAWPHGVGTSEETAGGARDASDAGADTEVEGMKVGSRHGHLADSGVDTAP